ncbi:MAG: hypothetical protein HDT13_02420 [Butyrivibrio sp.]|nr:hypothetical protein [Butyrivibrio sp.]
MKKIKRKLKNEIMSRIVMQYRENQKLPSKDEAVNLFSIWREHDIHMSYSDFIDVIIELEKKGYLYYIKADPSSRKTFMKGEVVYVEEYVTLETIGKDFPETLSIKEKNKSKIYLKYPLLTLCLTIIITILLSDIPMGYLWNKIIIYTSASEHALKYIFDLLVFLFPCFILIEITIICNLVRSKLKNSCYIIHILFIFLYIIISNLTSLGYGNKIAFIIGASVYIIWIIILLILFAFLKFYKYIYQYIAFLIYSVFIVLYLLLHVYIRLNYEGIYQADFIDIIIIEIKNFDYCRAFLNILQNDLLKGVIVSALAGILLEVYKKK